MGRGVAVGVVSISIVLFGVIVGVPTAAASVSEIGGEQTSNKQEIDTVRDGGDVLPGGETAAVGNIADRVSKSMLAAVKDDVKGLRSGVSLTELYGFFWLFSFGWFLIFIFVEIFRALKVWRGRPTRITHKTTASLIVSTFAGSIVFGLLLPLGYGVEYVSVPFSVGFILSTIYVIWFGYETL